MGGVHVLADRGIKTLNRAAMAARRLICGKYRHFLLGGVLVVLVTGGALAGYLTVESPGSAQMRAWVRRPSIMMGGTDQAVDPLSASYRSENRTAGAARAAKDALVGASAAIAPTGFARDDYLDLISGVVTYFRQYQDKSGRIIDPYLHREIQYSTPTYALAAATLIVSGRDAGLLESASRALDSALYQLASGAVTDRHGDFFILPAMLAYRDLKGLVDPRTRSRWDHYLKIIDPRIAYTDLVGKHRSDVMNWNSSAIAGEFVRHKEGFTDLSFVDKYLAQQIIRFTPDGLYRDPGVPLVYDASARFNFLVLLDEGYAGAHREDLEILLERGAWLSLLMQSPSGDAPTGGRSTDHVWSDALQCAAFELWARRMEAAGDEIGARAFKRGAHLAAQLMSRWVRPSGEFSIVKNHFDPALRRGFEEYSSHSQYNLLAAAYLSLAWSFADDRIAEGASPADAGGFVLDLPQFHKVFANAGGDYIEIETAADPHYNSTGLLREQHGKETRLGLGENAPLTEFPLALGVGWTAAGETHTLAEFPSGRVRATTSDVYATPQAVGFSVSYRLDGSPVTQIRETYTLTPDTLSVSAVLEGPVTSWRVRFPAFLSDGRSLAQTSFEGSVASIISGDAREIFEVTDPPGTVVRPTGRVVQMRTGDYIVVEAEGPGNKVSYRLGVPVSDNSTIARTH